jgi:hypothetical protein
MMRMRFFIPSVLAILIVAAACSSGDEPDSASTTNDTSAQSSTPSETAVDAPEADVRPDRAPLVQGPRSEDGIQAILGTGDLGVGRNRFGFVLTSSRGFVTEPTVRVVSRFSPIDGPQGEEQELTVAEYQAWPYGNRGLYATDLAFDRAGRWGIEIEIDGDEGTVSSAELFFEVGETTEAPNVGDAAIKSVSKTADDVESLSELTTGSLQDEDLYQLTIADAVGSGRPTVVVFASPAFCTNAVCGPQVEVLQQLKDEYGGQANFVHVDFYDNPQAIQGDLSRSELSPAVIEWNLPSIEWTFVIDAEGNVSARFEAFATYTEVKAALKSVL